MEAQRTSTAALGQRFVFGQPAPSRPACYRTVPPPDGQPILGASACHLTWDEEGQAERSFKGVAEACCALGPRRTCLHAVLD
ncbi:uncharacterized [Tachysurus ichikawai]